jgi:oligosaccharide reducing-end xylanase
VPSFFEIWAEYAKDGHEDFYRECADVARKFLHKACHPVSGLTPDYAEFDGSPQVGRMSAFGFDSWRVPMNIAMDYSWYAKDKDWQKDYGRRLHDFLYSQGVHSFVDQYSIDGSPRERIMMAPGYRSVRHSLGFVSTAATASIMGTQAKSWEFVDGIWNAKLEPYEDEYFDPYYDGFLYLFSVMHLSGNYQIIKPAESINDGDAANRQINLTETAAQTVEDGRTGP